jgi:hypothetical protein
VSVLELVLVRVPEVGKVRAEVVVSVEGETETVRSDLAEILGHPSTHSFDLRENLPDLESPQHHHHLEVVP